MTGIETILQKLTTEFQFDVRILRKQADKYPLESWIHAYSIIERMENDVKNLDNGPAFFMRCLQNGPIRPQNQKTKESEQSYMPAQYPTENNLQDLMWRIQCGNNDDLLPDIKKEIQKYSVGNLSLEQIDSVIDQIKDQEEQHITSYFDTFKRAYRRAKGLPTDNEAPPSYYESPSTGSDMPPEPELQDLVFRIQAEQDDLMPKIRKEIQKLSTTPLDEEQIDQIIERTRETTSISDCTEHFKRVYQEIREPVAETEELPF